MVELKKPSALELERMLSSCVGHEVTALQLPSIPRLFNFSTGIYSDYSHQMVGALVLDIKLCCCLIAAFEGLDEEAAQELVLTQEISEEQKATLRGVLEVLSCAFFLDDGSDRLRCALYELVGSAELLSNEVKRFMAAPPCHAGFQVSLPGFGEGTLVYIAIDSIDLGENNGG